MPSFDYITTPDLRISLEADHKEMCDCAEVGAWKSVQVLAGSIVEALLVDYLISTPTPERTRKDPLKMDLSETISICKSEKAISERSADLCSVIRSYRNLIHPARMVRLGEQSPSKTSASVATALIEMIADEIAVTRRSTVGLTGEQILSKISNDTGCIAILEHLLTEVSEAQKENLLLNLIPNHYFANVDFGDPFSDDPDRFSESYRIIFDLADESIKKRVAQNFVTLLKEKDGIHIKEYGKAFFRSQDLKYVETANRDLVKAHLLGTVPSLHSFESLKAIEKIGPYLTPEDCTKWLDPFVRTLVSAKVSDSLKKKCREVLSQTSFSTVGPFDEAWRKRLSSWQTHYEKGDSQSNADLMKELQDDVAVF